jgi:hypothetical protein
MTLLKYVERLRINENHWAVRKDWLYDRDDLLKSFGQIAGETEEEWLIPCWHILNPPATRVEIEMAQEQLGYKLPDELHQFLQIANGARLYCLTPLWLLDTFPNAQYQRYHIFSTLEVVTINQNLLKDFRAMLGNDPDFRDLHTLNYVAFCDAHDGNYLAILREGPEQGKVFFLDHEYLFRPYSERDADLYYTIAESLEAWLELVVKTKGWGGFGRRVPPL